MQVARENSLMPQKPDAAHVEALRINVFFFTLVHSTLLYVFTILVRSIGGLKIIVGVFGMIVGVLSMDYVCNCKDYTCTDKAYMYNFKDYICIFKDYWCNFKAYSCEFEDYTGIIIMSCHGTHKIP